LDHYDQCFLHHLPCGSGAVNVDLVVDPDLRNNRDIEIPTHINEIVRTDSLDRNQFVLGSEDVGESNRLGTIPSIRCCKDPDNNLFIKALEKSFCPWSQIRYLAGYNEDAIEKRRKFLAIWITEKAAPGVLGTCLDHNRAVPGLHGFPYVRFLVKVVFLNSKELGCFRHEIKKSSGLNCAPFFAASSVKMDCDRRLQ